MASVQATGFLDFGREFESYTPMGSRIKALFDDKKYVVENARALDWPLLRKYYSARGYSPAWCRKDDHGYSVDLLLGFLRTSYQEGLNPDDYRVTPDVNDCSLLSAEQQAEFDVTLTNAFFRYSKDVNSGRLDPKYADDEWHIDKAEFDPVATLEAALKDNNLQETLANLPPPHREYLALKAELAKYRLIEADRLWPHIPEGRTLQPGEIHPLIPLIRRRLADELNGGLPLYGSNDQLYDNGLRAAVESFQRRHGLEVDGIIGHSTYSAMNMTPQQHIRKIITNMERWRWMPRSLGEKYIMINLPGFEMNFIKQGQSILSMRTISGSKETSSPSFETKITQIIFNPTWTVPNSIAINELVPQQQQDPDFLAKSDIEVLLRDKGNTTYDPRSIDWSQINEKDFPYMLRQRSGPNNSLGRIKFQTPNKYAIFLHDTPYHSLFGKRIRALSHGCIRLEKPKRLAAMLLNDNYNPTPETEERVTNLMESKQTVEQDILAQQQVPVYIVYITAWVDRNGVLQLRDDIYGRDRKISNSLSGQQFRANNLVKYSDK
ncbi:MAG: L,D-transpeptidase family protein [Gammaproteobacteria bacterium]